MLTMSFLPFYTKAQVSEMNDHYSAYVLARVYNITKKVKLEPAKQEKIAALIRRQDSIANTRLLHKASIEEISKLYDDPLNDLKGILSPIEFFDYTNVDLPNKSQIACVLTNRDKLKLTSAQIEQILTLKTQLYGKKDDALVENPVIERKKLLTIISADQYNSALIFALRDKALMYVDQHWKQATDFHIVSKKDSAKFYFENESYELNKIVFLERLKSGEIFSNPDSLRSMMELRRPFILWKLDSYNQKPPKTRISEVIKYRYEIGLSESQIDTLVSAIIKLQALTMQLNQDAINKKVATKDYQIDAVVRVLNRNQLNKYSQVKNLTIASANVSKYLAQAKAYNLDINITNDLKNEIFRYESEWLALTDRIMFLNSQEDAFAKRKLELNKPTLLKKLDQMGKEKAAASIAKGGFSW